MSVEDVLAIQKLLADYNHLIDSGQADAWADLFVADGAFDPGLMPPINGRAALVEFAAALPAMIPGARHVVSNVSIDVDGDRASAKSYLHMWMKDGDGKFGVMTAGIYSDELVRIGGSWKLSRRTMAAD